MNPDGREVVQTIASESGRYRAEIVRRPTGGYQVDILRWTEEWVERVKVAEFWEPVGQGVTLTDTVERAGQLAAEKLRICEPPNS
jgi:hypothetical protein